VSLSNNCRATLQCHIVCPERISDYLQSQCSYLPEYTTGYTQDPGANDLPYQGHRTKLIR